jgi:hypothetical protein
VAEPTKFQRRPQSDPDDPDAQRQDGQRRQRGDGKSWAEWKQELSEAIEQLDYACAEARQIIYKLRPLVRPRGERSQKTPPPSPSPLRPMRQEIDGSWSLAKESYPDALVFVRIGDAYFVRGADVQVIKERLGIRCFGDVVGFDIEDAWHYMRVLADRGYTVLRAERDALVPVSPNGHQSSVPRPRGRFIAVDGGLLFEHSALARIREHETVVETVRDLIARNDHRGLREYGELYVFEFDGGYEIDWELSTIPPSRALLIAKIASELGEKIQCRLVLPKAWRGRRKQRRDHRTPQPPKNFGQMRLEL